jgi:prevent-host-death family protein
MPLPQKIRFDGQKATVTVTEFRSAPGDALDRVSRGMEITVTKNGKPVAVLSPPKTVINSDGSFTGRKPLTLGLDLGGEYSSSTLQQ